MTTASQSAIARPTQLQRVAISEPSSPPLPGWAAWLLIAGFFLTLRGYHAFDGDQAYRLPLLVDRQDPAFYATDPFVRAFDAFNPHSGYLALIDLTSRPLGLAVALAGLFLLTLGLTAWGIDRLSRLTWPDLKGVGLVAVVLVLAAKAGNIGTNHLFEATLLDRLVGFALGWLALALAVGEPRRGLLTGAICLGLASLIHPSVGLQLALTLGVSWGAWGFLWPTLTGVKRSTAGLAMGCLALALAPSLVANARQAGRLFAGLSLEDFRLLAVMVQGPQHMLPSTWRLPQWLAWGCYPSLAILSFARVGLGPPKDPWPAARVRLAVLMGVNLASLVMAYLAVEVVGDLKVTIFQPFRMATLARGLALVVLSGRLVELWTRGDLASRGRVVLLGVGLTGDWAMVVASAVELTMSGGESAVCQRLLAPSRRSVVGLGLIVLTLGLVFLSRHDTESGHLGLLGGLGALVGGTVPTRWWQMDWSPRRVRVALVAAWAVPLAALVTPWLVNDPGSRAWSAALVGRCRFAEVPIDDLERLAFWCRVHTPATSRFIGPAGPKTFRYWSRRPLAFNRAASPYHAEGLADWARRFQDHVGFSGTQAEFARTYLRDRHDLEAGFGRMTDDELASLAHRQGATHVLVSSARPTGDLGSSLKRVRTEGRYAIEAVQTATERVTREISKNLGDTLFNPD